MAYFTERESGAAPRISEEITEAVAGALVVAIQTRIRDGSFGHSFPATCSEYTSAIIGTDEDALSRTVLGYFPSLSWPLQADELQGNLVGLDLVEFTFEKVAKPLPRGDNPSHAEYASHQHLTFLVEEGRNLVLEEINRLFERAGLAFDLEESGQVVRIAAEGLRQMLAQALFQTGNTQLDELLETARRKFLNHDPAVRREALEKLWDAFERVRTLEPPHDANKKASVVGLLERALPEPNMRARMNDEFLALGDIGNKFMIRHTEVGKIPISSSEDVDYLFHRMFAAIRRVLRATGRGG